MTVRPSTADAIFEHLTEVARCLPDLLRQRASEQPEAVALREKRLGRWREISWAQYWRSVQAAGLGLCALGVESGDRIAIHSENRPEWLFADLGAQGIGAIPFGIYPTNPAAEVSFLLSHSGAKVLIAEDQEQLDKALEVRAKCPDLKCLVVIDPRGVRKYSVPGLMTWADLVALGERELAADASRFERVVDSRTPDETATMVYTSGTTGPPKGALLSTRAVFAIAATAVELLGYTERDETLSYLPLCHAAEKYFAVWNPLTVGSKVAFAEGIEAVQANLVEIQPTVFLGVPRIWQKMEAAIDSRMRDAPPVKRANYALWMWVARWLGGRRMKHGGRDDAVSVLVGAIGNLFLYRSLKVKLGMLRCRRALSGSAPISRQTLEFFLGVGVPICEAYGLTECVTVAFTREGDTRIGTVGTPARLLEVRLADDGEIEVRGPLVFSGYFRDPEATARVLSADGWLSTGDVGTWQDGHLVINDRKKDIIITAGGKNVTPSEVENQLKASPLIREAIVVGEGRTYLVALIAIENDTVSDWAQRHRIPFTTYRDLTEKPEVRELIRGEVERANSVLNRVEQVKKFRLLPKELEEEDQEVTATQKVKRARVAARFADLIDDMYGVAE